ncbi:YopX family protein [Streptococcus uberis]|nr:YopX family protein [Streptococcus uberis]MCK1199118.1 YopX family protein [Streptococcus uberis]
MIPKFRAWDKRNKKWVESFYLDGYKNVYVDVTENDINPKLAEYPLKPLDNIELMQSTGVFDKNGVEIFEGDVVEYIDGEFSFIGKVIKSPLGTYVTGSDNHSFEDFTDETTMVSDVSVVGNIYENPDLLESVEE